jgi:hypothetical protein
MLVYLDEFVRRTWFKSATRRRALPWVSTCVIAVRVSAYLEMNSRSIPEPGGGEEAMAVSGLGSAMFLIANEAECSNWAQVVCEERGALRCR